MNHNFETFRNEIKEFVAKEIFPIASKMDNEQTIPKELIDLLSQKGFFGSVIKKKYGGLELNSFEKLILHQEIAKGYGSIENILTVAGMVALPIQRFGTLLQKEKWLPLIASGKKIAAIALTEPETGSDLKNVQTELTKSANGLVINGKKKWITLGQLADLFLVLCKSNNKTVAILIDRNSVGLNIKPINGLLGLRANMLAELHFDNCRVEEENILGAEIEGVSIPITFGLDEGRFTTSCGSLGLASGSLEIALNHVKKNPDRLGSYQLIKKLLTEMIVDVRSAEELCYCAAKSRDNFDVTMIKDTLLAKYAASKAATNVSSKAIQVMGASGCHESSPTERYYRDAKIMELIEGATEIHEVLIAQEYLLH